MTDPTTPTDDDLSLALDGAADAELLARIEASPGAQARLGELRAAAALVSTPVEPLDGDTVDDLVAAALDAPVAPLVRSSSRGNRRTPWLVAASVIVLMAVGLTLVWAGRGTEDDQASADRTSAESVQKSDGEADSSFAESSDGGGSAAESSPLPGGHGAPTTVPPATANTVDLPVSYLGSYPDGDALREATATSFADALRASDSTAAYDSSGRGSGQEQSRAMAKVPSDASVDRCAEQLQITLSLKAGPIQTGYATVDDQPALVYEFAATSARNGKETTLVAAVGADACNEIVLFER